MAQSTIVDSGASGSKSLKQSPGWKSSGPTPSSGSGPRLHGGGRRRGGRGRGRIRDRLLAAAAQRGQPPDQQTHDDDGGRGGADPHGALAAQPAAQLRGLFRGRLAGPGEGAAAAPAAPGRPGRREPGCPASGRLTGGTKGGGGVRGAASAGRAQRELPGAPAGRSASRRSAASTASGGRQMGVWCGGADRSPGPPAGGTPGRPGPLRLSFSSVTENSPLSSVFAAAGRAAEGPVSGSPLRNSI